MADRLYMEHQADAAPMLESGTQCDKFILKKMLSVGGFGQVFEADSSEFCDSVVKVEAQKAKFPLLFNECSCLKSLNAAFNPDNIKESTPFLQFYGYGNIDGFRWLAMEKCGDNLSDLRRKMPLNRFSVSTSLYILSKSVEALQKMHSIGWLHRDIKPANFCISLNSARHVYLLDFGMSRIYVEKDGSLKARRVTAPFRGTLRYVSINIHLRQDASRWDDLWSAFYIATENIVGHLPWRRLGDAKLVEQTKMTTDLCNLKYGSEPCRPNSLTVMENRLTVSLSQSSYFYQPPPYDAILREIAADFRLRGWSMSTVPLDWTKLQYPPTYQYQMMQNPYPCSRKNTPHKKRQTTERKYEQSVCFY